MILFWVNFHFSCFNIIFLFFSKKSIKEKSWKSETSSANPEHQTRFMFYWCGTCWKLG